MRLVGLALLLATPLVGCAARDTAEEPQEISATATTPPTILWDDSGSGEGTATSTSDPSVQEQLAPQCSSTPLLENSLTAVGIKQAVSEGPVSPLVEAIRQETQLPAVSPAVVAWSYQDTQVLDIASWANCPELAVALLKAGAPVEGVLPGRSPAFNAAVSGSWGVVEVLLEAGAGATDVVSDGTVLHIAGASGDLAALEMVLRFVELSEPIAHPLDPLTMALGRNWEEGVRLLVANGHRVDLGHLLLAAEVTIRPSLFDILVSAASQLSVSADNIEELCRIDLDSPEVANFYRLVDLRKVFDVAGGPSCSA